MGLRVEELEMSGKPVRRRLGSPRRTSSRTIDAPFQQRWPPKGKEASENDMAAANAPKLERGLLEGIAGNGYALLRTYKATGDVMWARRAAAFARVIAEDLLKEEKARPVLPHKDALWKIHHEVPWPTGLFEPSGVSGIG